MNKLILVAVCVCASVLTVDAHCSCKCDTPPLDTGIPHKYSSGFSSSLENVHHIGVPIISSPPVGNHKQMISHGAGHGQYVSSSMHDHGHHSSSMATDSKSYAFIERHQLNSEFNQGHHFNKQHSGEEDNGDIPLKKKKHHNIHYKFEYGVNDKKTGDKKHHKEERKGDDVVGEYSLVEEDGNVRTVKYRADWETGFHAQVFNSKHSGG